MQAMSPQILIVEDSQTQALQLQWMIKDISYDVKVANNGLIALDMLKNTPFSIVITDLIMPEMDGFQLCQSIRELSLEHYVYILIVTAKHEKKDIISGIESGADDYLIKPIDRNELIARLKTAQRILDMEHRLKQQYHHIHLLSITDQLTQAYNRRYLYDHLTTELKRCGRYGHPLSLLLCDIDHFKRVNDTNGHLTGDLVLQRFVHTLQQCIRTDIDWIVRFGGEEFAIILPETDFQGAMDCAERCRRKVEDMSVATDRGLLSITASFGVVTILGQDIQGDAIDSLLSLSDTHLYQAKQQGRNQVVGTLL